MVLQGAYIYFFFKKKAVQCSNREREKQAKAQNELPEEGIYQLSDSLPTNSKDTIDLNSVVLSDATLSSHPAADAEGVAGSLQIPCGSQHSWWTKITAGICCPLWQRTTSIPHLTNPCTRPARTEERTTPEEETLNAEDRNGISAQGPWNSGLKWAAHSITGNLLGNDGSSSWDKEHLWETAWGQVAYPLHCHSKCQPEFPKNPSRLPMWNTWLWPCAVTLPEGKVCLDVINTPW